MTNWTRWGVILLATQAMLMPSSAHTLDDALKCGLVDTGSVSLQACDRTIANSNSIESSKDLALAHANRGLTFANMNNYQKALSDETAAITLNPKLGLAYLVRSKLYERLGKQDLAKKDAREAHRLNLSGDR